VRRDKKTKRRDYKANTFMDEGKQMSDYDTMLERQHERDKADAEREADWRKDQARHLMQRGEHCYPWTPQHIQEALEFIPHKTLEDIAHSAQEHELFSIGHDLRNAIESYWESVAEVLASKMIYEGD
jgi:hypothetical protein